MFNSSKNKNKRLVVFIAVTIAVTILLTDVVSAQAVVQVNESRGPGGYGWQQVFNITSPTAGIATRLTGSGDRRWYDWGFKRIQLSARVENYWSRDSGWWYVNASPTNVSFLLRDARNITVLNRTDQNTTRGRNTTTYEWNTTFGADSPGEWVAQVSSMGLNSFFNLFVRGMLNVTNITTNSTPDNYTVMAGQSFRIVASLRDHAGNVIAGNYLLNNGTSAAPNLTLYITGAGEDLNFSMSDSGGSEDAVANDGNWSRVVTLNKVGDHKVVVKASDEHTYWIDGRRSTWVFVNGTYNPDYNIDYASITLKLAEFIRWLRMIFLAPLFGFVAARKPRSIFVLIAFVLLINTAPAGAGPSEESAPPLHKIQNFFSRMSALVYSSVEQGIVAASAESPKANAEFRDGLVVVNTIKPVYSVGERAELVVAALNRRGLPACDAAVELIMFDPRGKRERLKLEKKGCGLYSASYAVMLAGRYRAEARAKGNLLDASFAANFYASERPRYGVSREADSVINPMEKSYFRVRITVDSAEEELLIKEILPGELEIIATNGKVASLEDRKIITWRGKRGGVFEYTYSAPARFALYEIETQVNELSTKWYLAVDPLPLFSAIIRPSSVDACIDKNAVCGDPPATLLTQIQTSDNVYLDGGLRIVWRFNASMFNTTALPADAVIRSATVNIEIAWGSNAPTGCTLRIYENSTATWRLVSTTCKGGAAESTVNYDVSSIVDSEQDAEGSKIFFESTLEDADIDYVFLNVSYVRDAGPPLWRNLGTNATGNTITRGQFINLSAQGNDTTSLFRAILETNHTGVDKNWTDGSYGSPMNLGNLSNTWVWSNFTWRDAFFPWPKNSSTFRFRIWYEDEVPRFNVTDYLTVIVNMPTDNFNPNWSAQNQQEVTGEDFVTWKLNAFWRDDVALHTAVLSTNVSGSVTNTSQLFSQNNGNASSNFTWVNIGDAYAPGTVVKWKIYANDTSNKWNVTDEMSFTIGSLEVPITGRWAFARGMQGVELEEVTQQSCFRAPYTVAPGSVPGQGGGGCHLIDMAFNKSSQVASGTKGSPGLSGSIQEWSGVRHPSANRDPAGFFAPWVHRRMGGSNWPQWNTDGAHDNYPVGSGNAQANISAPTQSSLYSNRGYGDVKIGDGTGRDRSFNRTHMGYGRDAGWDSNSLAFLGNPWGESDLMQSTPATCAFGFQIGTTVTPAENNANAWFSGCHGIFSNDAGAYNKGDFRRTDNISCAGQCHQGLIINSTNDKHGRVEGAKCDDCHLGIVSRNATEHANATLNANNTGGFYLTGDAEPRVRWCLECHQATSNWNSSGGALGSVNFSNFLPPPFVHSGKDCRFCHGHGMNITRQMSWGKTCGGEDLICHSKSAPSPRDIGPLTHGSTAFNVTCGDCHLNPGEPTHNATIPQCRKCHNSTGWSGSANDNSSASGPVPNWDSRNRIYHGNASRGGKGGKFCAECHLPRNPNNLSEGYVNITDQRFNSPHKINNTQLGTRNFVPLCQASTCHGNATTPPQAPPGNDNGTWIPEIHASGVNRSADAGNSSGPLQCTSCHNNRSIRPPGVPGWIVLNTSIHASFPSRMVPFDINRSASGSVQLNSTDTDGRWACVQCHNTSLYRLGRDINNEPYNCALCHGNLSTGALLIHDADMEQAEFALIDGRHEQGNPQCERCHDIGKAAPKHVNISTTLDALYVHRLLNSRTGDPGFTEDPDARWGSANRKCWACHSNGSVPNTTATEGDIGMGLNRTSPWQCPDCHLPTGSQNDKYPMLQNLTVVEHIPNGTAVRTASNASLPVLWCLECHNKSEMLLTANDPDDTDTMINQNPGKGYTRGGNESFYHYGKRRSDIIVTINASAKNLFNKSTAFSTSITYCPYCHQNPSTNFSTAMNNSVYHTAMLNHSSRNGSPHCNDCHGFGRLHDSGRIKPYRNYTAGQDRGGMWNSSLCMDCHDDRSVHGSEISSPNANVNLTCAGCHANASLYNDPLANDSKQIHGIRYLQGTGAYSSPWNNASAVECRDCHVSGSVTLINSSNSTAYPPSLGISALNHSDAAMAGGKWGSYWNDSDASVKNDSCYYCHGNARGNGPYGDPKHNASALGRVEVAYTNPNNLINGSISPTSAWCGSCHYPNNANFSAMMARFRNESAPVPPNNTAGGPANDGTPFQDHTSFLSSGAGDSVCRDCHGGLLSTAAAMDEFAHRVKVGQAGDPDCVTCHDFGGPATPRVNVSAMERGVHSQLNNRSGDPGNASVGGGWSRTNPNITRSFRCWACHSVNGTQPANGTMGVNKTTPWQCPDCHTPAGRQNVSGGVFTNYSSAPIVLEHFGNGSDVRAASNATFNPNSSKWTASCLECHLKGEMLLAPGVINDPNNATEDNFNRSMGYRDAGNNSYYHYGLNRSGELRLTRNASTLNLFGYSNLTRLQYTNCLYCHQNASTAFASAMNNSLYHREMLNHSSRNGSPFCADCHGYGTLHNSNLSRPYRNYTAGPDGRGMWNSSLCTSCHTDRAVHGSEPGGPNANVNLTCAGCHANASLYNDPLANDSKQIHGIRYLRSDGSYSTAWNNASAVECKDCHVSGSVTLINSTNSTAYPPRLGITALNHSSDVMMGGKWGSYWNDSDASPKNDSCYYCHGNAQGNPPFGDPKHNATALGRVNVSFNGTNLINGSVNETSRWCGSCHYPQNSYYGAMMARFRNESAPLPPNNTNMEGKVASDGTAFFQHSGFLSGGNDHDKKCTECHGGLLVDVATARMDEFAHRVDEGRAGNPDCGTCHDFGGPATPRVNVSAMRLGVHSQLNNRTGDPGPGSVGGGWSLSNRNISESLRCWACHSVNGTQPANGTMGVNKTTPWQCPDCHTPAGRQNVSGGVFTNYSRAPIVSEHFGNGSDVKAASNATFNPNSSKWTASCLECHLKGEMLLPPGVINDPNNATEDNFNRSMGYRDAGNNSYYHYGLNRSGEAAVRQTRNASTRNLFGYSNTTRLGYTNCLYCHQNATTAFASAMNNSLYHREMLNHSARNGSPFCADCHGYGTLHGTNLTIPYKNSTVSWRGMWNSSLCMDCHDDRRVHGGEAPGPGNLTCAGCHANASLYNDPAANDSKQIHGIRYLRGTGAYSSPWNNASAVECRDCHTGSNITLVNSSYITADVPRVLASSADFAHSDSARAGAKWNNASPPFWNDTDASLKNDSCYFCHGNARGDVKHNATALGRANVSWQGNNTINGSINSTSQWCGSCHYPDNPFYNAVRQRFTAEGVTPPPNNTDLNFNASDGTAFVNHTDWLVNDSSDVKCLGCHGGLLPEPAGEAGMDQFAHRVRIGEYGNVSCTRCHREGGQVPRGRQINLTAMNQSKHSNISTRRPFGAGNKLNDSEPCWACHLGIEGEPNATLVEGGGNTHPANYSSPKDCYFCHQYSEYNGTLGKSDKYGAPIVTSHTRNASYIFSALSFQARARTDCWNCHNYSVADGIIPVKDTALFNASHYQTLNYSRIPNATGTGENEGCEECHAKDVDTSRKFNASYLLTPGSRFQKMDNTSAGATECWKCHVADCPSSKCGGPTGYGQSPSRSHHDANYPSGLADSPRGVWRVVWACNQAGCHPQ